jgi:hypothetical protein
LGFLKKLKNNFYFLLFLLSLKKPEWIFYNIITYILNSNYYFVAKGVIMFLTAINNDEGEGYNIHIKKIMKINSVMVTDLFSFQVFGKKLAQNVSTYII